MDLGIETFLLTATIEAIVAQRLVRRVCTGCKEEYTPTDEQLMELALKREDVESRTFFRGAGCEACNHSGYKGRMAIFEIMQMDDDLRDMVMEEASITAIRAEAIKRGMTPLRDTGMMAIFEGQTTIDEVVRETIVDE